MGENYLVKNFTNCTSKSYVVVIQVKDDERRREAVRNDGTAILLQDRRGPEGSRSLSFPDFNTVRILRR
jgi:hypothetical protein